MKFQKKMLLRFADLYLGAKIQFVTSLQFANNIIAEGTLFASLLFRELDSAVPSIKLFSADSLILK